MNDRRTEYHSFQRTVEGGLRCVCGRSFDHPVHLEPVIDEDQIDEAATETARHLRALVDQENRERGITTRRVD